MGGDKRGDTKANLLSSIPDYKYTLFGPRRVWQLNAAQRGWPIFWHGLAQDDRGGIHGPHSPGAWHALCPMRSKKKAAGDGGGPRRNPERLPGCVLSCQ